MSNASNNQEPNVQASLEFKSDIQIDYDPTQVSDEDILFTGTVDAPLAVIWAAAESIAEGGAKTVCQIFGQTGTFFNIVMDYTEEGPLKAVVTAVATTTAGELVATTYASVVLSFTGVTEATVVAASLTALLGTAVGLAVDETIVEPSYDKIAALMQGKATVDLDVSRNNVQVETNLTSEADVVKAVDPMVTALKDHADHFDINTPNEHYNVQNTQVIDNVAKQEGLSGKEAIFDDANNAWIDNRMLDDGDYFLMKSGDYLEVVKDGTGQPTLLKAGISFYTSGDDNINTENTPDDVKDYIFDQGGNNTIKSGGGDDFIYSENGSNIIDAGEGNNTVVVIGEGNNSITAGNGNNAIITDQGADTVNVGNGNNAIDTGGGKDVINAGKGMNTILSGAGDDSISVKGSGNKIYAGDGNDSLNAGNGNNNKIYMGNGNDTLKMGNGDKNTVSLGAGNDKATIGNGDNNKINFGAGNDTGTIGNGDKNKIDFGSGNDKGTIGNGDSNKINFGTGDDTGTIGNGDKNTINFGAGDDKGTIGNGDKNTIDFGSGNDKGTIGNGDKNTISAGAGNDTLSAGSGDKNVYDLGSGNDKITLKDGGADNKVALGTGKDTANSKSSVGNSFDLGKDNDRDFVDGNSLDDSLKNFGDQDVYKDKFGRSLSQEKVDQYGYTGGSASGYSGDDWYFDDDFYYEDNGSGSIIHHEESVEAILAGFN